MTYFFNNARQCNSITISISIQLHQYKKLYHQKYQAKRNQRMKNIALLCPYFLILQRQKLIFTLSNYFYCNVAVKKLPHRWLRYFFHRVIIRFQIYVSFHNSVFRKMSYQLGEIRQNQKQFLKLFDSTITSSYIICKIEIIC